MAGLPTDRFVFGGFLPAKVKARGEMLEELAAVRATLVFYETGPRLVASLEAIAGVWPTRAVSVARELTKLFEECRSGSAEDLARHYRAHPARGEIVLLIGPGSDGGTDLDATEIDRLLTTALVSAKPSQAAGELARMHGLDRKVLYARALELLSR